MSSSLTSSGHSDLTTTPVQPPAPTWKIKLLYDGACPLCLREVNFLRRRDAGRGWVALVDVAEPNYNSAEHGGVDFETAMGRIHAVLPDGTVIQNIEVFRQVYEVLGMGWVYAITKLPVIGAVADWLYGIWADRRLALTGRADLATIVAERQQVKQMLSTTDCTLEDGLVERCRLNLEQGDSKP